ncbi:arginine-ornithine APC transporter [Mesoplasma florum L1]|uniref:Arginine-ornithine APC transporter n=1 Tax=Mesoplasma florum (strain ATCC 33453 / NBRC 100688 / NCTC 11704 / L1) TaxID=265311 RepID=Q6F2A2_MESFL|nr:YfcC family protein [Mesoplasma florum]AAT75371.1 arginine-ornithine APC transporter [Mesoplasma florum L1]ATI72972.1 YfcC family protein [Mesoplasma florum]AVN61375.1 YfcC family protein [Mesoplasma florum]
MKNDFKIKNPFKKNKDVPSTKEKKQFKMLSAFTILLLIIAFIIFISWILKWSGVSVIDDKNESHDIVALGIFDLFIAPINGFVSGAEIIVFLVALGGFLNIVICSKALEGFSQNITSALKGKEIWAIIPLMVFFSIVGSAEGMAEESLGFYMICIPLMMAAGFDKLTGFMIVLLGAGVGVMNSTVNPFAIGVAVDTINGSGAGIETSVGDGLVWRLTSWFVMTTASIIFVMWYSWRVKMNPQKSVVFKTMEEDKKFFLNEAAEKIDMNWKRKLTLVFFGLTFILMIFYMVGWDSILGYDNKTSYGPFYKFGEWINTHIPYLSSQAEGFGNGGFIVVSAIFLLSSIVLGLVNGLGEDGFLDQFMAGAKDLFGVCLVIAVAGGIGWALEKSLIQQLVVSGLASSIGGINSSIGILIILFILFIPLSLFIPSTSGFARAVFPLLGGVLAKDSDVLASGSITAFSMANGFINLFTPTSGIIMAAIGIAKIDYTKFFKVMWPILVILFILSIVMISIGGAIGGNIA